MELSWENRGLIRVKIGERELMLGGEAMIEGPTDFVIYAQYLKAYSDGTKLTEQEKVDLLDDIVAEAASRGWRFEISW